MCFVGPRQVLSYTFIQTFADFSFSETFHLQVPIFLKESILRLFNKISKLFKFFHYLFLLFLQVLETFCDSPHGKTPPKTPQGPYQTLHHRAVRRSDFQSFRDQPRRTTSICSKVQPRFLLHKKEGKNMFFPNDIESHMNDEYFVKWISKKTHLPIQFLEFLWQVGVFGGEIGVWRVHFNIVGQLFHLSSGDGNKTLVPGHLESATLDFSVNDVISSTFTQLLSSKVGTKNPTLVRGGTGSKDTPWDLGVLTFHTSSQQNSGKKQSKHFICRKTPGDTIDHSEIPVPHGFSKKS